MEDITMKETQKASLAWLIWWSVRLAWARNKLSRRRYRQLIWMHLEKRWRDFVPDSAQGIEVGIVRAVWLGSSLASRSIVCYPLRPPRLKGRLVWMLRRLGRRNGKAIIAAYLAWTWLYDAAVSFSVSAPETWGKTGG